MIGYVIAAGVAGLVTAGYNTMAPRSQLYGRTFIGNRRGSRQLALTFDDGPNDPHTLKLLEVLARHEVRATFFVLGQFVAQRPDILREVVRSGHVIGNHTYGHPNLIFSTQSQVEAQIRDCERVIAEAVASENSHPVLSRGAGSHKGGAPEKEVASRQSPVASLDDVATGIRPVALHGSETRAHTENIGSFDSRAEQRGALAQDDRRLRLFRPPYGGRRPGVLRTVRRLGYVPVMWSVSGWDWSAKSAEEIERTVVRQVRGGDVILLHDGGHERMGADRGNTVIATDRLIARYKSEGYEFVTVPAMIETAETQRRREQES